MQKIKHKHKQDRTLVVRFLDRFHRMVAIWQQETDERCIEAKKQKILRRKRKR